MQSACTPKTTGQYTRRTKPFTAVRKEPVMDKTLHIPRNHVTLLLLALPLLTPLIPVQDDGPWLGLRLFAIQACALGLFGLALAQLRWSPGALRDFAATGPNLAIVMLIGWATLSL